jgi:hypothetical protein
MSIFVQLQTNDSQQKFELLLNIDLLSDSLITKLIYMKYLKNNHRVPSMVQTAVKLSLKMKIKDVSQNYQQYSCLQKG